MYKQHKKIETEIEVNKSYEGERIEEKVERILSNKEPIKDNAPIIYTSRNEGVIASTNIRTDRFEEAITATELLSKSYKAKREERMKMGEEAKKGMEKENGKDGITEPIQGTK